jgi:poly-gamma-glutamate capsule biosynthesis protein CapA/YwtB (metallophosphatase superfamily)
MATFLLAAVAGGSVVVDGGGAPVQIAAAAAQRATPPTTTPPPLRQATLAFAGDVRIDSDVWNTAAVTGGYDFSPMLAPIAARLRNVDLAICHLDVTLARPSETLSDYPRFGAPIELARDLHAAGFDGCSVASDHALDFGEAGVVATLDGLDAATLAHVGTARAPEDRRPAVYEAGGIRVAHLSYASGFGGERPVGKAWLADEIDPALILSDAHAARAAGAEVVVVSLHWGDEYVHEVVDAQRAIADALAADPGAVDLIVGHHAPVVQPISKVGSMWVVWGMGNLLSDDRPPCCTAEAADGVVVDVSIGDASPGGPVAVTGVTFTPTWNERRAHRVLPAEATLAAQQDGALTDDLTTSLARTTEQVLSLGASDLGVTRDP